MRTGHGTAGDSTAASRAVAAGVVVVLLVWALLFIALRDGDGGRPEDGRGGTPTPTPSWDSSPDSLAAVGDSITRGFDACSLLSDCPKVSWATGSDPDVSSLAQRLLDDPAGDSWNLARSGAVMADLPHQMKRAATYDPELVTVLTGANDACQATPELMTPVEEFRADFEKAMRTLRAEAPKTQVFVASVPDLKRVWSLGSKDPLTARIWSLGICQSMLRDPSSMGRSAMERRDQVHDRVVAYNGALRDVCAADLRCRYDGGAVFDYRFDGKELSEWDWFHPSWRGQRQLAELAFRAITAP